MRAVPLRVPRPVLAEVVRSGFVEGVHHGSVVALDPSGLRVLAVGQVEAPMLPRSSNKPAQAVGMLAHGLADVLTKAEDPREAQRLLALSTASHSGEPVHVALVQRMLALAGLDESALACPEDLPLDVVAQRVLLRSGAEGRRVHMNCSGKHAAMLATCVAAGWPTHGYLAADHPLQIALREAVERLAGEQVSAVATDGCGAPLFALSLVGLARTFAALVDAAEGTDEHRLAAAARAHPELVAGTGRDATLLMRQVPGLLAKDGADGVYAAALPGVGAVALKIDDGAARARVPVLLAGLAALGVVPDVDAELRATPLLGGGVPVGAVRSAVTDAG